MFKTDKRLLPATILVILLLLVGCGTDEPTETPVPPTATTAADPAADRTPSFDPEALPAPEAPNPAEMVGVAMQHIERPEGDVLATVNGQEVTWEDYEPVLRQALYSVTQEYGVDWSDSATQQRLGPLQKQVLDQTIDRWLLRQLAEAEGITVDEAAVETRIEEERAKILGEAGYPDWQTFLEINGFTDESLRLMIHDTMLLSTFVSVQEVDPMAEQVHISHIVVGDEAKGRELLARIEAGEDFAELAVENSLDADVQTDHGDKGWFTRDMMEESVADIAFSLEPGQVSDLIGTPHGYAIVLVMEHEVRELDPRGLAQRQQQAVMAKLAAFRNEADIEYLVDFAGTGSQ